MKLFEGSGLLMLLLVLWLKGDESAATFLFDGLHLRGNFQRKLIVQLSSLHYLIQDLFVCLFIVLILFERWPEDLFFDLELLQSQVELLVFAEDLSGDASGNGFFSGALWALMDSTVVGCLSIIDLLRLFQEVVLVNVLTINELAKLLHKGDFLFSEFQDMLCDVIFSPKKPAYLVFWPLGSRHRHLTQKQRNLRVFLAFHLFLFFFRFLFQTESQFKYTLWLDIFFRVSRQNWAVL